MNQLARMGATLALASFTAFAGSFVNGNFESGSSSGWIVGGGDRSAYLNNALDPASFLPGGSNYNASIAGSHSTIVTPGFDANTGNQLNRVYQGNYSWRVEDLTTGGYASVISQQVSNYTDTDIYFAWAAVLQSQHDVDDAATIAILLRDLTTGIDLISRVYNAASSGGGIDSRFKYNSSTGYYWTQWQIEQLTLPTTSIGHDLQLTVLAADCEPTGHRGYLYLDGFGAVTPPVTSDAPEPGTIGLVAAGLGIVVRRALKKS